MKNVVVYTSDSCTYCTLTKNYLRSKGIQFETRNIKEPVYRRELMQMRLRGVPVIKVDDAVIVGFDRYAIDEALR
ncbi:MAG: glutaredoxin family protein [Clostridium sp.]|uniref:glutaredoxin family protein n=1 Tax=Clostridium sp. TaxID=1506 RepID=UPI002A87CA4C|nr:glutaredoxin family protein [Clostridium sp.]MDY5098573.1 glutaredoxin family protein [Clostridium sp.]